MAYVEANLITVDWMTENIPLTKNVDPKELMPFIIVAQDIYIQETIGTALYQHLMEVIDTDVNTLTSDEIDLLVLIRKALGYYVLLDFLPSNSTKVRNLGLVNQTGDNLSTTSDSNRNGLRAECKQKAEFYLKRVQDYLCKNGNKFPLYHQPGTTDIYPNGNKGYTCGLGVNPYHTNHVDFEFFKKYFISSKNN